MCCGTLLDAIHAAHLKAVGGPFVLLLDMNGRETPRCGVKIEAIVLACVVTAAPTRGDITVNKCAEVCVIEMTYMIHCRVRENRQLSTRVRCLLFRWCD